VNPFSKENQPDRIEIINGILFGTSATTSLKVTGLVEGDLLTVSAYDGASIPNISDQSAPLTVSITYPIVSASSFHGDTWWNEPPTNALDADVNTKWAALDGAAWLQLQYENGNTFSSYAITNQNNDEGRDPQSCYLEGSNDGSTWTPLHSATGLVWTSRSEVKTYSFTNTTAYKYYRFGGIANDNFTIAEFVLSSIPTAISTINETGARIYTNNGKIVANLSAVKGASTVSVFDTKGVVIKTIQSTGIELLTVNVVDKGIYLVQVKNAGKVSTVKVVL